MGRCPRYCSHIYIFHKVLKPLSIRGWGVGFPLRLKKNCKLITMTMMCNVKPRGKYAVITINMRKKTKESKTRA